VPFEARDPGARHNNGDYVQVSPPEAAEFKGNDPVLQTEVWQGLKLTKHEQLITTGLKKGFRRRIHERPSIGGKVEGGGSGRHPDPPAQRLQRD
jgi:hypothetical protein